MKSDSSAVSRSFATSVLFISCCAPIAIIAGLVSLRGDSGSPPMMIAGLTLIAGFFLSVGAMLASLVVLSGMPLTYGRFVTYAIDIALLPVVVPAYLTISWIPGMYVLVIFAPSQPVIALTAGGFLIATSTIATMPLLPWIWPWCNRDAWQYDASAAALHPIAIPPKIVDALYLAGGAGVATLWSLGTLPNWCGTLVLTGALSFILIYRFVLFPIFPIVDWSQANSFDLASVSKHGSK